MLVGWLDTADDTATEFHAVVDMHDVAHAEPRLVGEQEHTGVGPDVLLRAAAKRADVIEVLRDTIRVR